MTLTYIDRVKETTTTTGTGTYTLAGAVTGFQAFSTVGNGNTCYYAVSDGTNWEVGLGTYTLSGTTLARTTILASSTGSAINWGVGTRTIWLDFPAAAISTFLIGANNLSDLPSIPTARLNLTVPIYVATRTALKALDTTKDTVAVLTEAGRQGTFLWTAGTYTTQVAADTAEGVYVKATAVAASAGAWVRVVAGVYKDSWFGVKADSVINSSGNLTSGTDDTAALQAFAAFIKFNGGGHYVLDGGSRKIWPSPIAHGTYLLDIRGVVGATIEYRNAAELHAMYPAPNTQGPTGTIWGIIWRMEGNQNITFLNARVEQEEKLANATSNEIGLIHFSVEYNAASALRTNRNIRVLGARQKGGVEGFVTYATVGGNGQAIQGDGFVYEAEIEDCYYGFVNQGGVDNCRVNIRSERCGRTLFWYNAKGLTADLDINSPQGTSGNVNITLYADTTSRNATRDLKIRAKFRGTVLNPTSNHALMSHNLIWLVAGGLVGYMADIHTDLDVDMGAGSNVRVLRINKYDNSGGSPATDTTTRGWVYFNNTWSGAVASGTTVDPFDLFCNNPLGNDNWTGEQVGVCGFDGLISTIGQNLNFDGRGINAAYSRFFFRDSYFASTFVPTNALGKYTIDNSPSIPRVLTYTPVWTAATTNPVIGNGSIAGEYEIDGDNIVVRGYLAAGSTTTYGSGIYSISLPITPKSVTRMQFGAGTFFHSGGTLMSAFPQITAGTSVVQFTVGAAPVNTWGPTIPVTMASGDTLQWEIRYLI